MAISATLLRVARLRISACFYNRLPCFIVCFFLFATKAWRLAHAGCRFLRHTAENAKAPLEVRYDFLKLFIPRRKVRRKDFVVCCNNTTIEFILLCAVVAICRSLIVGTERLVYQFYVRSFWEHRHP